MDTHNCLRSSPAGGTTSLDIAEPGPDGERPAARLLDPADDPVAALPVKLREGLVLRELEDLSYKEIAHVTGVPIGTVMSRLWWARRALTPGHAQAIIDLYVWPNGGHLDHGPTEGSRSGYNFLRWSHDGMAFWAVSDLDAHELADFVRLWQAG